MPLLNGQTILKRMTAYQNFDVRIAEQGVLQIQPNTVFHKQEIENSKPRKVLKFTVTDGKLRLRPLVVDRDYFLKNYSKYLWVCFYDNKYQSLVRLVQTLEEKEQKLD